MKIAVVGNGTSLNGSNLGRKIDSCDEVMRFTKFTTEPPYQKDVGTRTTIWSTYINLPINLRNIRLVLFPMYGVPEAGYDLLKARREKLLSRCIPLSIPLITIPDHIIEIAYQGMGITEDERAAYYKPTSGLVSLTYLIRHMPDAEIYVCGFDGYCGPRIHYYENRHMNRSELRRVKPEKERQYFKALLKNDRVQRLQV